MGLKKKGSEYINRSEIIPISGELSKKGSEYIDRSEITPISAEL
jgi:hypothetical protein